MTLRLLITHRTGKLSGICDQALWWLDFVESQQAGYGHYLYHGSGAASTVTNGERVHVYFSLCEGAGSEIRSRRGSNPV